MRKEWLVNAADAMPDDKFGYKSTPAQRSYGEQIMHVVQANQSLVGMLGGKTPAPAINMKAATKAEVMTALRQSMDYWEVVLKEFTDQQLNERVATPPCLLHGPSAPTRDPSRTAWTSTGRWWCTSASTALCRRPAAGLSGQSWIRPRKEEQKPRRNRRRRSGLTAFTRKHGSETGSSRDRSDTNRCTTTSRRRA